MPQNIEIKAQVEDSTTLRGMVELLADTRPVIMFQKDTFFCCSNGRLKLRQSTSHTAELIYYQRDDLDSPNLSDYLRTPIADPTQLRLILKHTLGERGTINKRRELFVLGQTRLHIDQVEGLGNYLELEVVLTQSQNKDDGIAIAEDLMRKLEICRGSLVPQAYIDLLEQKNKSV